MFIYRYYSTVYIHTYIYIFQYPILLPGIPYNEETRNNPVYKYFTGTYNLDEICCSTGQSVAQIEEIVERDPNIVMLWK